MIEFLTKVSRGSVTLRENCKTTQNFYMAESLTPASFAKMGTTGKDKKERMKIMAINYSSTRGGENNVTASMAILKGLAADGGLFMPDHIPTLDCSLEELSHKTYQEVAYAVMEAVP